jgi:hypothetical protein
MGREEYGLWGSWIFSVIGEAIEGREKKVGYGMWEWF